MFATGRRGSQANTKHATAKIDRIVHSDGDVASGEPLPCTRIELHQFATAWKGTHYPEIEELRGLAAGRKVRHVILNVTATCIMRSQLWNLAERWRGQFGTQAGEAQKVRRAIQRDGVNQAGRSSCPYVL